MEIDIATMIAGAAVTGGVSAVATVAAIKVELRWLKHALSGLEQRVRSHDEEIRQLLLRSSK